MWKKCKRWTEFKEQSVCGLSAEPSFIWTKTNILVKASQWEKDGFRESHYTQTGNGFWLLPAPKVQTGNEPAPEHLGSVDVSSVWPAGGRVANNHWRVDDQRAAVHQRRLEALISHQEVEGQLQFLQAVNELCFRGGPGPQGQHALCKQEQQQWPHTEARVTGCSTPLLQTGRRFHFLGKGLKP